MPQVKTDNLHPSIMLPVKDGGEGGVCGSWGKGSHLGNRGARPARRRKRAGSWLQTVEEHRCSEMAKDAGDGLATFSRDVYAQSECYCALFSSYTV